MAKYTSANVSPEVGERARRLARHRGLPLAVYLAELIDADHKATFGEEPDPGVFIDVDAAGVPTRFVLLDGSGIEVPAALAADFADNVERIATKGGALADLSEGGDFLTIERHGPAVVITSGDKRWSVGVHRARQIAREISDKAAMHLPKKVA